MVNKRIIVQVSAWLITVSAVSLAFVTWAHYFAWHIFSVSTYHLFPIFGLMAFSLLWSQYMVLGLKDYMKIKDSVLSSYFKICSWLVLVFILLHPGLLVWQLWRDGQGLPPGSEIGYVKSAVKWVVILGMINLTILLLFQFRRLLSKYRWWHYFRYVVDLVVLSVLYHGLRLGDQLQKGWYRKVWFFYGISYLAVLIYIYSNRFKSAKRSKKTA